jgi:tRNA (guanine-N(7)-)-methyltransferase
MKSKDIEGVLYGSRLVTLPHVKPEVDAALRFVEGKDPVLVEIGFDHGYRLLDMAIRNPSWRFLGLEVRERRVEELRRKARAEGVSNLMAWRMDARTVIHCVLDEGSVDVVDILYPTPWWDPRKRQKRLLIDSSFLRATAEVLRPNGLLRIETDVEEYGEHIGASISEAGVLRLLKETRHASCTPACVSLSRRQAKSKRDNLKVYGFQCAPCVSGG